MSESRTGCEDCRQVVCRCDDVAPATCAALDCERPPFTRYRDGADYPWWLCEEHGDLLAVGFATKHPRQGEEFRRLDDGTWEPIIYGRTDAP